MSHEITFAGYPSPELREQEFVDLVYENRENATLVHYGQSVEGRPLVAARLASFSRDAPKVICCANIHGLEFIGNRVCQAFFREAARASGPFARLRHLAELWVVPCINPDGYAKTWNQGGRGALSLLRTNARGVDLNRNFPLPYGAPLPRLPGAGSSHPGDATYRGPFPFSEPESKHLDDLFSEHRFHASANLHSFMGTVIPARVTDRKSYKCYHRLAQAIQSAQPHFKYRRLANRIFDVFTGEQEDHQHHCHRTWSICLETFTLKASFRQHLRAPSQFWRFNPRLAEPWIQNDVAGLVAFFLAALDLARPENSASKR